jgi:hypothetical protein
VRMRIVKCGVVVIVVVVGLVVVVVVLVVVVLVVVVVLMVLVLVVVVVEGEVPVGPILTAILAVGRGPGPATLDAVLRPPVQLIAFGRTKGLCGGDGFNRR